MPERDYVCDRIKMSYKGIVCFDELYKKIHKWFAEHGYDFHEMDEKNIKTDEGKKIAFVIEADRRISDYVKLVMGVNIKMDDVRPVKIKGSKKNYCRCELSMDATGYLAKDYESSWTENAFLKFMRETYDRYVTGGLLKSQQELLKAEVKELIKLAKDYCKRGSQK